MASRAREERKRLANASKKAACATDEQLRELFEELKGRTKELDSATEVIRDLRECLERERAAAAAARSKHALQLKHAEERVAEATQTARKDMEQERQRNLSKLQHEYDRLNRRSATLQQDIVAFTDQQRKYQQDVSRQQESFAKQQDELRRQQDELRRQQDELRRQQDELRKQQQETASAGGMVVRPHDLSVVLDTLDRTTLQADTLNATRRQLAASNEMLQTANAKLSQDMQKLTRENVVLARANAEHAKLVDVLNKQFLTLQTKCQAVESSLSACERVNADLRNTTQGLRYQNEALHQELARLSRSAAGRIDRDNSCRPSPDDASDQEDLRIAQKDLAKISTIW